MTLENNHQNERLDPSFLKYWILANGVGLGFNLSFLTANTRIPSYLNLFLAIVFSAGLIGILQSLALSKYPVRNWMRNTILGWIIGIIIGIFIVSLWDGFVGQWLSWIALGTAIGVAQSFSFEHQDADKYWIIISIISLIIMAFLGNSFVEALGFCGRGIGMFVTGAIYGAITGQFLEFVYYRR